MSIRFEDAEAVREIVAIMSSENNTLSAPTTHHNNGGRRHSSSSAITPPRSPTVLIHKPPSSPGGLSSVSGASPNQNSDFGGSGTLSPAVNRFFTLSPTTKKVCTMDCGHCRHLARSLREESASPLGFPASAPCSRKSSVVVGKKNVAKKSHQENQMSNVILY